LILTIALHTLQGSLYQKLDISYNLMISSLSGCGKRVAPLVVNRIMSGELAVKGAWPWQASLQRSNIHQCGATLISNVWLVTAAHCFKK
jgi:secreted trypsin-like serine protease